LGLVQVCLGLVWVAEPTCVAAEVFLVKIWFRGRLFVLVVLPVNESAITPRLAPSDSGCLWCDDRIRRGEPELLVSFNVKIPLIGKQQVSDRCHVRCGSEISKRLVEMAAVAERMKR